LERGRKKGRPCIKTSENYGKKKTQKRGAEARVSKGKREGRLGRRKNEMISLEKEKQRGATPEHHWTGGEKRKSSRTMQKERNQTCKGRRENQK